MSAEVNPYQSPEYSAGDSSTYSGESIIRVSRTTSYADRPRAYRILVDGVERAQLKAGDSIDIPVDAGSHTVAAKVDWCGSPTVSVTTQLGSTTTLECASNLQGSRLFLAIFYTILFRDQYLTLAET